MSKEHLLGELLRLRKHVDVHFQHEFDAVTEQLGLVLDRVPWCTDCGEHPAHPNTAPWCRACDRAREERHK